MAIIKLTDATWLELEASKVLGVLKSNRALGGSEGQAGKDVTDLVAMLSYHGLNYTPAQLTAIRTKLVGDGKIEIV